MLLCKIANCGKPQSSRFLCRYHYHIDNYAKKLKISFEECLNRKADKKLRKEQALKEAKEKIENKKRAKKEEKLRLAKIQRAVFLERKRKQKYGQCESCGWIFHRTTRIKHCTRNKDCKKIYNRIRRKEREKDPEYRAAQRKRNLATYHRNKHKYNAKYLERLKEKPEFRIIHNLRTRVRQILKANSVSYSKKIGCSGVELRGYIEAQFQPGMTWDNYGEWHLDHKYPLSLAIKEGEEAFIKACHYTNLQPLWAKDNISKGNKTTSV